MRPKFFLPGDDVEDQYRWTRDFASHAPGRAEAHDVTEDLWQRFEGLDEPDFREKAKKHFNESFWEMYVAVALREHGLDIKPGGAGHGPDFRAVIDGKTFWIEATCATPGTGPDRVPDIVYGVSRSTPRDKIALRITNALSAKSVQYGDWLRDGRVKRDEGFILALNSSAIPFSTGSFLPYFVNAVYPVGDLMMEVRPTTDEPAKPFFQQREAIAKVSGNAAPTTWFTDSEYAFFSGLIHSTVDCVNRVFPLGHDFRAAHHTSPLVPIPETALSWMTQWRFVGDTLYRLNPQTD